MDTGVAEWPAVPWNAWSHCNQCSAVWGSQNETLWTLIQRCESMKLAQWQRPQHFLFYFFIFCTAFCFLVCPFCFLSLDSDSPSNVYLQSCGSLGENWNVFLGSLYLEVEKVEEKTAVFKNPEKVGLTMDKMILGKLMYKSRYIGGQVTYCFKLKHFSLHPTFLGVFCTIPILCIAHSYSLMNTFCLGLRDGPNRSWFV